jgi:hypothetical protein
VAPQAIEEVIRIHKLIQETEAEKQGISVVTELTVPGVSSDPGEDRDGVLSKDNDIEMAEQIDQQSIDVDNDAADVEEDSSELIELSSSCSSDVAVVGDDDVGKLALDREEATGVITTVKDQLGVQTGGDLLAAAPTGSDRRDLIDHSEPTCSGIKRKHCAEVISADTDLSQPDAKKLVSVVFD